MVARWGKLVFTRDGSIYAINADGSDEKLVYDDLRNLFDPAWSPDDSKIVYARNMSQGGINLFYQC